MSGDDETREADERQARRELGDNAARERADSERALTALKDRRSELAAGPPVTAAEIGPLDELAREIVEGARSRLAAYSGRASAVGNALANVDLERGDDLAVLESALEVLSALTVGVKEASEAMLLLRDIHQRASDARGDA